VVIGIDTAEGENPREKALRFRSQHRLTYPILVDEEEKVAEAFAVMAYPTNVLIDRAGRVRYVGEGFDPEEITEAVRLNDGGARRPPARGRAPGR
jgi:peroxiredoxin